MVIKREMCLQALKWVQSAPSDQIQSRLTRFGQMARRFLEEGPQILDATIPWEARRKLAIRLSQLNQDHVTHMLKVLEHLQPEALPAPTSGTDLTIDIDRLTLETMERLQVCHTPFSAPPCVNLTERALPAGQCPSSQQ